MLEMTVEELLSCGINIVSDARYKKIKLEQKEKDYSNKNLYRGIHIDLNRNIKVIPKKLYYEGKIGYKLKADVTRILQMRGKTILFVANAGGGKTYTMLDISSKLVEMDEDKKTVYILTVPNSRQSNQNQVGEDYINFGFKSIVGKGNKLEVEGKEITVEEMLMTNHRKFSCVYDLTIDIVEKAKKLGLEVVLIIDEAHKLVNTFREGALNGIEKASLIADMVIHMTATPDKCKAHYSYDEIYELIDEKPLKNIGKFKIVYTDNWQLTLRRAIKRNRGDKKISLINIDSLEEIKALKSVLEKEGYIVEVLTSENKESDVFKEIEKTGLISDDVDVVLCTSVVECGISIKSTNIRAISVVRNCMKFDADNTIQFFARPRKKIDEGMLIVKNTYENISEAIKNINSREYEEFRNIYDMKYYLSSANDEAVGAYKELKISLVKALAEGGKSWAIARIKQSMKRERGGLAIELDEEKLELHINSKKVIMNAFAHKDSILISSALPTLKTFFEGKIFYDDIEIISDNTDEVTEEEREEIQASKEEKKANREMKKEKNDIYREWFKDEEFLKLLPLLMTDELNRITIKKFNVDMSLRELIEFKDSSLYETIKENCLENFRIGDIAKIVTSTYKTSGEYISLTAIKEICELREYVEQNKIGYSENLKGNYHTIRKLVEFYKKGENKSIKLNKNLGIILYAELTRTRRPGYTNKQVLEIVKDAPKKNFDWKKYYTSDKIKKLESAISSKNGGIKPSIKNKVKKEIGKVYGVSSYWQDKKEYTDINNPIKIFSLNTVLEEIISSK